MRQLEDLQIEEGGAIRVQPCHSPVWDTAIATIALADTAVPDFHPALLRSVRWLLEKEVRVAGDCYARGVKAEPSGWHFQFHNERYPDIDDTAMVLLALHATALRDDPEVQAATGRAVNWLLALQNSDGGWAAYDRDINNQVLDQGHVRRSQRDARPELRRYHGKGRRDARNARPSPGPPGHRLGLWPTSGRPRNPRVAGMAGGA